MSHSEKVAERFKKAREKHEKKESKKHEKKEHESKIKKAMHHPDKLGAGAAKRKHLHNPKDKVETVMKEFKRHTLRSGGSGKHVTNPKQAIAIGLSEAREAGAKIPKKKK